MTLEQAIDDLMDVSRSIAEVAESESDEANRINAQNVADDCKQIVEWLRELQERRKGLGIVRCKNCIYYDPPHVENNGVRYEYTEMPADAFDVLGTGLVTTEYGINIGGRCCRDYNTVYDDDKRVYVPENNYCGRAERRTDG